MKFAGWILALLWALPNFALAAEDAMAEILGRLREAQASEFRYEEIRTLELASTPVKTQGYMLSGADGSLVKLQLLPRRIIMAISGGQMLYYDQEQKQRHAMPLDYAGSMQQQILLFRSLLQGHVEELKANYEFAADRRGSRWSLKLTPKPGRGEENGFSVELAVDDKNGKREILIRQQDGESSRYLLEKIGEGKALEYSIQRLLLEAVGE